jgi:hypothetical protein
MDISTMSEQELNNGNSVVAGSKVKRSRMPADK